MNIYRGGLSTPRVPSEIRDGVVVSKDGRNVDKEFHVVDVEELLVTDRIFLRKWKESDADDLYRYASDPAVGPIAGWPPHQSVQESLDVIRNVFSGEEAYAICMRTDGKAIGAIELKLNGHTDHTDAAFGGGVYTE